MKTENEVVKEIENYIDGEKHNRTCTLSTIKKALRTSAIIDLIFSHSDMFNLDEEFEHIPLEHRSERILIQYVLGNPTRISSLTEEEQTFPILIAFEFAKRRFDQISASQLGRYGTKIPYLGKSKLYKDDIVERCDYIFDTIQFPISLTKLIETIQEYCGLNEPTLNPNENYERKFTNVDFNLNEQLLILVSGCPDSGKTTFSRLLAESIKSSTCFDSDMLLEQGLITTPFQQLVKNTDKVIIFSDLDAHCFFTAEEIAHTNIINIIIKPSSIKKMHRNSKYMSHIPFEQYKKNEIRKYNYDYDTITNLIIVSNDYTNSIYKEVDETIEVIKESQKLNLPKNTITPINYVKK